MPSVQLLFEIGFALALLSAIVHALLLAAHRREDVTLGRYLLFGGVLLFDHRNFRMGGWAIWRRFRISFGLAALFAAALVGSVMVHRGG